ncbi:putative bifunctional diguanylate cyclase/phosphodiesterase [Rhizobium sp. PAMB 3174]
MTQVENLQRKLKAAQAEAVASNIHLTLFANSFIALSLVMVLRSQTNLSKIYIWFACVLAINALRCLFVHISKRRKLISTSPEMVLRVLVAGAACSGISWATVPLFFGDATAGAYHGQAFFIVTGVAAGALIQSAAYAPHALAFFGPVILATAISFFRIGDMLQTIVGINATMLLFLMIRASLNSEKAYLKSQRAALAATSLAQSLSLANSEIQSKNTKLEILANRDPLTGLVNRAVFHDRLKQMVAECQVNRSTLALLILDLDRFKSINDIYGHHAGDRVLIEFADRIGELVAEDELVGRLGGDEFAIIIPGPDAAGRARQVAEAIVTRATDPVTIAGRRAIIGSSVGIAHYPEHASNASDLFTFADMALYEAKARGRRRVMAFNDMLCNRIQRERLIESSLEQAIANGEIRAVFQPQVVIGTGEIIGFEALVRWTSAAFGEVKPAEIVDAASVVHYSRELTGLMANEACRLIALLDRRGLAHATVAVNLSPREFASYSPSALLKETVDRHGVRPDRIEVEITEEALLDTKSSEAELKAMNETGFKLAVDDFGMGHSSFAYLLGFKIDRLKIDRSFVNGITTNRHNQALVTALISAGRALDIDVLTEGVETVEDAETLRLLGCRLAQGYLYGKPMRIEDIDRWLDESVSRHPPFARV